MILSVLLTLILNLNFAYCKKKNRDICRNSYECESNCCANDLNNNDLLRCSQNNIFADCINKIV